MVNDSILHTGIEEMAGKVFDCSCGKAHKVDIRKIRIGSGILNELPDILSDFTGKKVFLVADTNTYKAAGSQVESIISDRFKVNNLIFKDKHLHPDAEAIGKILLGLDDDTGLILAVGSGTINDCCRFISHKTGIPYAIVGTAPSMDGYASVVSNILVDGIKSTINGVYPYAIIADISIMKEAPMHMLQAGLGDVIGKYTALCDWMLSNILNGEYYCENIAVLVEEAVRKCVENAHLLSSRESETVKNIIEALILTGVCIGLSGSSRPASGAEHNIAHFWEMDFIKNKFEYEGALHGNLVGCATGVTAAAYEIFAEYDIEKVLSSKQYMNFTIDKWQEDMKYCYGSISDIIIKQNRDYRYGNDDRKIKNADDMAKNWEDIRRQVFSINPGRQKTEEILKRAGAVVSPSEMHVDRELFIKSIIASKELKQRYTIFQTMEDAGVLKEVAQKLARLYY